MNDENVKEAINKAATVVLEDWAMAFLGDVPEGFSGVEVNKPLEATVCFSGTDGVSGRLSVITDQVLAESICRSVLGVDGEEELDLISSIDTLKELVNVLGGHFLTEAFGKKPVFQLSAPECREVDGSELATVAQNYSNWFSPDENVLGVKVEID